MLSYVDDEMLMKVAGLFGEEAVRIVEALTQRVERIRRELSEV